MRGKGRKFFGKKEKTEHIHIISFRYYFTNMDKFDKSIIMNIKYTLKNLNSDRGGE